MPETKTLSKVEQFALQAARDKAQEAGALFNELIGDVAAAHGVEPEVGLDWQFTPDFSAMIYKPRPKQEEVPPPPAKE